LLLTKQKPRPISSVGENGLFGFTRIIKITEQKPNKKHDQFHQWAKMVDKMTKINLYIDNKFYLLKLKRIYIEYE